MNTYVSKEKKKLIRSFHASLSSTGMMKQKPAILESFGVDSTSKLSEKELQEIIDNLTGEADKWRKRVLGVIFSWTKTVNLNYNINQVKAIACRAAGKERFNQIPVSRLRDIYNEFSRKNTTTQKVQAEKNNLSEYLKNRN